MNDLEAYIPLDIDEFNAQARYIPELNEFDEMEETWRYEAGV